MGVEISRPARHHIHHTYYPTDTLIRCCGDARCCCPFPHRDTRYLARTPCGRLRPCDPIGHIMMNGVQLPSYWKDPGNWRIRDFEMMGEIVNDAQERMGRHLRLYGAGGMGVSSFMYGEPALSNRFPESIGSRGGSIPGGSLGTGGIRPGGAMRLRGPPLSWVGGSDDGPMLQQIGAIASEHDRMINQMRDFMGISDDAMRERAYRQRQQELWEGIPRMEREFVGPGVGMGMANPMPVRNPIGHQEPRRRWPPSYGDDYYNEGLY